jgi:hypothetical protein
MNTNQPISTYVKGSISDCIKILIDKDFPGKIKNSYVSSFILNTEASKMELLCLARALKLNDELKALYLTAVQVDKLVLSEIFISLENNPLKKLDFCNATGFINLSEDDLIEMAGLLEKTNIQQLHLSSSDITSEQAKKIFDNLSQQKKENFSIELWLRAINLKEGKTSPFFF